MPSESLSDLSAEQVSAHKFAARELARYCQEFSRWRKTKRGAIALDRVRRLKDAQVPFSSKPGAPPAHPSD